MALALECLYSSIDTHPTPPRPTSAARDAGFEHFLSTSTSISRSTKSGSRRKGTVEEGLGFGCDSPTVTQVQYQTRCTSTSSETVDLPSWLLKLT